MQVKTFCLLIKQMTNSREMATFICSNVKKTQITGGGKFKTTNHINSITLEIIEKMKSSP